MGRAFGRAAAGLVAIYAALFVAGIASPPLRESLFLNGSHQQLGQLPRFAALTGVPGATGAWALLAVGLVGPLRPPALRRASRVAGALVVLATWSAATLALPVVLSITLLRPGRARMWATVGLAAVAIAPLYVHVLAVGVGDRGISLSPLHPSYEASPLGSVQTPVHELSLRFPATRVRFNFTMYAALFARAASCFAEHPVVGVGPRRFAEACPVMTMNTYGDWSATRRPHNQFTELATELGVVGLGLLVGAARLLRWRMSWEPPDRWYVGAAAGVLVCSFSAELLVSLPVAGFFAVYLRPRYGGERRGSAYSSA